MFSRFLVFVKFADRIQIDSSEVEPDLIANQFCKGSVVEVASRVLRPPHLIRDLSHGGAAVGKLIVDAQQLASSFCHPAFKGEQCFTIFLSAGCFGNRHCMKVSEPYRLNSAMRSIGSNALFAFTIMKWSNRLRERKNEGWNAPLVWWVRQGEAEKKIKELKKRIKDLEANVTPQARPLGRRLQELVGKSQ